MELLFLCTATYNVICHQSLRHWFLHCVQEILHYLGELLRKMADHFIDIYGLFLHGVVKLSFSIKFSSNWWLPYISMNMISTHSKCEREGFYVVYWWPSPTWLDPGFRCLFQPVKEECILYALLSYLIKQNASSYNLLQLFLPQNWFLEKCIIIIWRYSRVIKLHI